jgi:hypothetical protein
MPPLEMAIITPIIAEATAYASVIFHKNAIIWGAVFMFLHGIQYEQK